MPADWLKHAFAIESDATVDATDEERTVAEWLCRQVVLRELTTPALIFLESVRPLNYVAAQALQFFSPLLRGLTDSRGGEQFARFLEQRGSIDWLCRRIEQLDRERRDRSDEQPRTPGGASDGSPPPADDPGRISRQT